MLSICAMFAGDSPLPRKSWTSLLVAAIAIPFAACSEFPSSNNGQAEYASAIARSAVVSPDSVHVLEPIPDGGAVEVVSWVSQAKLPCSSGQQECTFTVGTSPIWVTLDGEVKQKCTAWHLAGAALQDRLEQLLGLPPDSPPQYRKVAFVEMTVPRASIDRPCLGLDTTNPAEPKCTLRSNAEQKADIVNVVERQMADSYVVGNEGAPGYPFSRLGYTYDWNPRAAKVGHYGASEFLVRPGTTVVVKAQILTDPYCRAAQSAAR